MARVTFFLEKRKNKKTGEVRTKDVPIHIYFTFNGHRLLFFSGERIDADKWDSRKGQIKAGVAGRAEINHVLQSREELLMRIYREADMNNIRPTPDYIKKKYREARGTDSEKPKQMIEHFAEFIEAKKSLVSHGFYKHLKTARKHISEYIKSAKVGSGFESVDLGWLQGFRTYLIEHRDATHNTVADIMKCFRYFLNHATKTGINTNVRYKDYKISWKRGEVVYLTWEELMKLYRCPMPSEAQEQVRDVFCFACLTGMRYSDLKALAKDNIKDDFIRYNMVKTKQQANHSIPLNDYSREILAKYKDMSGKQALPVISNQKMNEHLKEIGRIAGIDEPTTVVKIKGAERIETTKPKYELLTTHIGRKTFISNSLKRGILAEVVMEMSGHTDHRSFRHYYKINDEHKREVMVRHFSKETGTSTEQSRPDNL